MLLSHETRSIEKFSAVELAWPLGRRRMQPFPVLLIQGDPSKHPLSQRWCQLVLVASLQADLEKLSIQGVQQLIELLQQAHTLEQLVFLPRLVARKLDAGKRQREPIHAHEPLAFAVLYPQ